MRILLSGSSGFIGTRVRTHFINLGHTVISLKRGDPHLSDGTQIFWDPQTGSYNAEAFERFDAVIHLAGEKIIGFWTERKKEQILSSRIVGTKLLSEILAKSVHPPKVVLSASAVGIYGDRGEEILTESSAPGEGFLASVCTAWEMATDALRTRVIHARFAPVIGPGGILQQMMRPFKWGLGGRLGSGMQWMSWIALDDLTRAMAFCIADASIDGPVNMASPYPVRQKEFASTLAKILHRPAFFHQNSWVLKMIFGNMAKEVLLASQKVYPEKLLAKGFVFNVPRLEEAIWKVLIRG